MVIDLQRGDTVLVSLNGRAIEGSVEQVLDTTSGKKVRVVSGDLVVTVNVDQILDVR